MDRNFSAADGRGPEKLGRPAGPPAGHHFRRPPRYGTMTRMTTPRSTLRLVIIIS